jgi:iron-sulfur cluster repair protein YtfE (RIC family)
MPTTRQEATLVSKSREASRSTNALTLLRKDHKIVSELFDEFERKSSRGSSAALKELAEKICAELTVHAQVEEEIFYPTLREAFPEHEDVLDEAAVEHASVKELVGKIQSGEQSELFEAQVCVLGEYVRHHVKEEHALFTKIQKSRKVDFEEFGAKLAERKAELQQG